MRAFRAIFAILSILCVFVARSAVFAQDWPHAKPITIVVPVPPGPSIDMIARLVAAKLQQSLGQTVIVDNRGGASGGIAAVAVKRAEPDGYTLLMQYSGYHVITPNVTKTPPQWVA